MFLPQYNPYQRSDGDVAAAIAMATMLWGMLILLGIFLLSAWCTKLVLQHLVNPYLKGALDRQDGLIVAWSALIWAVIGLVLAVIPSIAVEPELILSLLATGIVAGGAWGAAIGAFLVIVLWLEVDEPWEPTHGFEAITGLPAEHYRQAELDTHSEPDTTLDEVKAMFRDDPNLGDTEFEIPIPENDLPRESPATPAAVPIPSTNGRKTEAVGI